MTSRTALLVLLVVLAAIYVVTWARALRRGRGRAAEPGAAPGPPAPAAVAIGALTDFFDTLGVGSFAPTTSLLRLGRLVPDRLIPGTLNVGHAIPTVAQALIFIALVEVDARTLVLMIAASVAGAWLGAGVVAAWPRRRVQGGMALALLAAVALMVRQLVSGPPADAGVLALSGVSLALGVAGNFVLGALMTLGIGLYGPCMILVSVLGMNATAAFPIMMGSCAFLMPVAGMRFMGQDAYAPRAALGLTLGGVPAVLVAAFVVRSLSLDAIRVLVIVVATYTALVMARAAASGATADAARVDDPAGSAGTAELR